MAGLLGTWLCFGLSFLWGILLPIIPPLITSPYEDVTSIRTGLHGPHKQGLPGEYAPSTPLGQRGGPSTLLPASPSS
jgi:hypothetical protein